MSEQTSMYDDPFGREAFGAIAALPPSFVLEYLAGFAAVYAFGDRPTKAQQAQARAAAEQFGVAIQAMRIAR